ncbi:hypothetical protein ACMC56_16740 (plasmid) [Campylobacterota bacterium DY0563]
MYLNFSFYTSVICRENIKYCPLHMGNVKGETIVNRNASAVLVKLLEGRMKISKLQDVVRNYFTLKLTLIDLERQGYVKMEEKIEGRKVIYVELTPKGRAVAEKLQEASSVARLSSRDLEKFKNMRALLHLNVYEDHVSIMDIHMGEERIAKHLSQEKGPRGLFLVRPAR